MNTNHSTWLDILISILIPVLQAIQNYKSDKSGNKVTFAGVAHWHVQDVRFENTL